jgi:S1-C subfamily serine protease
MYRPLPIDVCNRLVKSLLITLTLLQRHLRYMHNTGMLFGFNWIDAIILLLLILTVIEGLRIGFLSQTFAITGFFGALFLAGWLFPHLLPIHDRTIRTIVNTNAVLLAAGWAGVRSSDFGQDIHWSFRLGKLKGSPKLETTETILGSLPAIAAGLALVWLLGVTISRMPFAGLSNSVSDSRIVQQLTRTLPAAPAVFADFDKGVNPNAQPYVFAQPKPQPSFDYSAADFQAAEATAGVVRITSFSCGSITAGSGFVVGTGLVATNAHVIAGSSRPIIKYAGKSYEGTPVYFDANFDLAIVRIQQLDVPALPLADSNAKLQSTVAVLGYPGGNYTALPGIIRDTLAVDARSIYDQGVFGRGVYVIQASIEPGSSGSPVVQPNGQVVGIIFSQSTDRQNVAYALTSVIMAPALQKAQLSHVRVSTGACVM